MTLKINDQHPESPAGKPRPLGRRSGAAATQVMALLWFALMVALSVAALVRLFS